MNPNLDSANKTYNIVANGTILLPVPANPKAKLVLLSLIINTKGGSGNTVTIHDSATEVGVNGENRKGKLDTTITIGPVRYGFPFFDGICLIVGGGTAPDITVVYAETP